MENLVYKETGRGLKINCTTHRIHINGVPSKLFRYLMDNSGKLLKRDDVIKYLYGESYPVDVLSDNLIRVTLHKVKEFIIDCELPFEIFYAKGVIGNNRFMMLTKL